MPDFSELPASELLDAVPWPSVVVGENGLVQYLNAAACSHFQVTPAERIGRPAGEALRGSAARLAARHLEAWLKGDLYPVRFAIPRDDGRSVMLGIPGRVPLGRRRAIAILCLPAAAIDAALAGHVAESASQAREWLSVLAADVEAMRAGAGRAAAPEARPDGDSDLARLTRREWEIARRIAEGDRVAVLADDLRISTNTVRNHLKAIFRKLGLESQTQLVRRLKRPRR